MPTLLKQTDRETHTQRKAYAVILSHATLANAKYTIINNSVLINDRHYFSLQLQNDLEV